MALVVLGINPESLGGERGAELHACHGGFEDHPVPISSPTVPGPDGALPRPDSGLTRSIITYPWSTGGRRGENLFLRNPLSSSPADCHPRLGLPSQGLWASAEGRCWLEALAPSPGFRAQALPLPY